MWTNLQSILSLFSIFICSHIVRVGADDHDTLQALFASAVAGKGYTLDSVAAALHPEWGTTSHISAWNVSCFDPSNNFSRLHECFQTQSECLSLKDIKSLYSFDPSHSLTEGDVSDTSSALLYSLLSCSSSLLDDLIQQNDESSSGGKPKSEATWGYGFLFVTLINLCSLMGAIVLPCMKFQSYKLVLMFMVALAVGTLAGSGLLFLLPEAFLLVHDEGSDYIWKSTTIMGGIYLFFITEKFMRIINARRQKSSALKKRRNERATQGSITSSFRPVPIDTALPQKDLSHLPDNIGGMCSPHPHSLSNSSSQSNSSEPSNLDKKGEDDSRGVDEIDINIGGGGGGDMPMPPVKSVSNGHNKQQHNHHHHHHGPEEEVAPVAYMIIFGDALHNFIDGLSIGSAFTQSIMTGVSVSVAVMCEELPHELGDFAILLNSGMSFKKALMYNFLSACTCYLGLVIGILLGENTSSHEWIFAIAGGMFLYISLVDMMPEMNSAAESKEGKEFGTTRTFLLQNAGLLTGFGIMLIFAVFGGEIRFE